MDADADLDLFEDYKAAGKIAEAEAMKDELLRRWPTDQAVNVAVADLLERQGRYEEALALMRNGHVNLSPRSNAYPHYLRMLIGAGHWDEASIESGWAFQMPTLWTPYARLARALALLHFDERDMARLALADLDLANYSELVEDWVTRFESSGAIDALRDLLEARAAAQPDDTNLAALRDRFRA